MRILRCDECKTEIPLDGALVVSIGMGVQIRQLEVCSPACVGEAIFGAANGLVAQAKKMVEERAVTADFVREHGLTSSKKRRARRASRK